MNKLNSKTIQIISVAGLVIFIGGIALFAVYDGHVSQADQSSVPVSQEEDSTATPSTTASVPSSTAQNESNSVSQRQEIVNEQQKLVAQLQVDENNSDIGKSLASVKSQMQQLINESQAAFNKLNADGRMTDYEQVMLNTQNQGFAAQQNTLNQMQDQLQNGLNSDYANNLKKLETNFCDLNPKITTDSNRVFCHSLFN